MATAKKKQQEATTPQVEARIDRLMDGDFKTKAFASATDSAPKDTWLSPSPIMEYRLSTSGTPSSAAHSDSSTPAAKARTIKG